MLRLAEHWQPRSGDKTKEEKLGPLTIDTITLQTYDIDYQTADSASTASALFSGVKTKYKTLGYDSTIDRYNSTSMLTATEVSKVDSSHQE